MRTFFALLLCACSSDTPRAIVVDHVDDLGAFPAPATVVGRDGTTSALVGSQVLWTFGDTFLTKTTADDGTSVRSATAGWSTALAPLALTEPVDDAGIPFQLVPYTAAELSKNQTDPLNGFALWPGNVIPDGAGGATVLFQHVLRQNGNGFTVDAIGTAHVTPPSTQGTRDANFLFQSPEPLFGNGGVTLDAGNAYFFECEQAIGLDFHCKVARVPVASVTNRAAFEFWDGAKYTSDITRAVWFIDRASYGLTIEKSASLGKWLAVYSKPLSDDVALRTAAQLEGPWDEPEVLVSGSSFVTGDAGTNYLAREHTELERPDAGELVIGYSHPLANFGGACRLARVTLK
jgi:hypothetical protein